MNQIFKQNKRIIMIVFVALAAVAYSFFQSAQKKEQEGEIFNLENLETTSESSNEDQTEPINSTIKVDVKGAVQSPGVYIGKQEDRVIDMIKIAGGFTENANQNAVNLAEKIQDQMVIYVPKMGEEGEGIVSNNDSNANASGGKVNLNSADENELQTLPGIGPSKAASIVEYRNQNGRFKNIDELKNITGIGEKTFEKLKDSITVN
ncbi:helix-hairpin-helix domain-containing protein [Peribacillus tepidiphilus]|uniref:helix-hairpin-helix domain-containing protein n=1 Tax=Peribacillus tepidiphilus TaxID=2652445 RepID=UPI0035B544AC